MTVSDRETSSRQSSGRNSQLARTRAAKGKKGEKFLSDYNNLNADLK